MENRGKRDGDGQPQGHLTAMERNLIAECLEDLINAQLNLDLGLGTVQVRFHSFDKYGAENYTVLYFPSYCCMLLARNTPETDPIKMISERLALFQGSGSREIKQSDILSLDQMVEMYVLQPASDIDTEVEARLGGALWDKMIQRAGEIKLLHNEAKERPGSVATMWAEIEGILAQVPYRDEFRSNPRGQGPNNDDWLPDL